jgi:hypothetical protein
LSFHPDHASPSASPSGSPSAYQLEVFRVDQVQRAPEGVRSEPRMSVSMTMTEYQGLMGALQGELSMARGLGREEGMRAMDILVRQLQELVARMYQEGQGLNSQCESMNATLQHERQRAEQWVKETKKELQEEAQSWVATKITSLEQQLLEERDKLERAVTKEREEMKKDFARQSASQADSMSRNIDEARQALKDSFQQQQVDLKAQILEQAQKQLEEYKRDLEVSAQKARRETTSDLTSKIGMETAMRNHQEACEAEFKQNALRYRDSIQAENAKETTLLQAMIDRLRSENSSLTSQRDCRTGLELQEQKKSNREAYERTFLERDLNDLKAEKEKFREAYNQAAHEVLQLKRENERLWTEAASTAQQVPASQVTQGQDDNRGTPMFGMKTTLFGPKADQAQIAPADRNPFGPFKVGAFPPLGPGQSRGPPPTEESTRNNGQQGNVQPGWHQPNETTGYVQPGWHNPWGQGSSGPAAQHGQGPPPGGEGQRPYPGGDGQGQHPGAAHQGQGHGDPSHRSKSWTLESSAAEIDEDPGQEKMFRSISFAKKRKR